MTHTYIKLFILKLFVAAPALATGRAELRDGMAHGDEVSRVVRRLRLVALGRKPLCDPDLGVPKSIFR